MVNTKPAFFLDAGFFSAAGEGFEPCEGAELRKGGAFSSEARKAARAAAADGGAKRCLESLSLRHRRSKPVPVTQLGLFL